MPQAKTTITAKKTQKRCSALTCSTGLRCKKNALYGRSVCTYHIPDSEFEDCPICMESMPLNTRSILRCSPNHAHIFHSRCLTKWFGMDKETCPTCRKNVPESIIHTHDPTHYERKKARMEPMDLVVPRVARFRIPRPAGMSDHAILDELLIATVSALSRLPIEV